jgi:hypothetical protein
MVHFSFLPSSRSRPTQDASPSTTSSTQPLQSKFKSFAALGGLGNRASHSSSSTHSEVDSSVDGQSTRISARPSVAWKSSEDSVSDREGSSTKQPLAPPNNYPFPISRTASLPTSSNHFYPPPPRQNPKLHIMTNLSSGTRTHPRQLDYSDWARYPIAKHLSPITEQDYTSPQTIGETIPLPEVQHDGANEPASSVMRKGSEGQRSDITRPSPVYAHQAFISRPLNRSLSQASSGTHRTASSSVPNSAVATHPPTIPPLDLTPAFPGPHRANTLEGGVTLRRDHMSPISFVSSASEFSPHGGNSDAQSYKTASEAMEDDDFSDPGPEDFSMSLSATAFVDGEPVLGENDSESDEASESDITDELALRLYTLPPPLATCDTTLVASQPSPSRPLSQSATSSLSNSSSFIHRRWDRVTTFGTSLSGAFHLPRIEPRWTPACISFWLGFSFPLLWLYGGWYFTVYQETGMTWSALVRQEHRGLHVPGGKSKRSSKERNASGNTGLILPLWAMHNCHPDESMNMSALTEDERRSVQKLYLGYPFVNSHVSLHKSTSNNLHPGPFNFLSKVPVVGIDLINSREETNNRKLDPWIWRCRVAFVLFALSSILVTIVLLAIYLPRALRE